MKTLEEVLEAFRDFKDSSLNSAKKKLRSFMKPFYEEIADFITEIVEEEAFPYLKNYLLQKYSEEDFHRKVDENFSIIEDLYANHYEEFVKQLKRARKLRRLVRWDSRRFCDAVVEALRAEGFKIRKKDRKWILRQVEDLRKEIYCDR